MIRESPSCFILITIMFWLLSCTQLSSTSSSSNLPTENNQNPPSAPLDESNSVDLRIPQSLSIAPFEGSSLLVPNKRMHATDALYSQHYWQARTGLDIWSKATFGNAEDFKSFDWFQILRTDQRGKMRWKNWGLISDPACCTPGKDCADKFPGKNIPNTYGYDYCPGDENLSLDVDAACDIRDLDGRTRKERNEGDDTLSRTACQLQFGSSAGVIGIRKFKNPKLLNQPDQKIIGKNSERPYVFGIACAACHAGLNPQAPPRSMDQINFTEISMNVGNPYLKFPKMMASGMSPASWIAHHLADTPQGRAPTTLEKESFATLTKLSLIANLDSRPVFESDGFNGPRFFINGAEVVGLDHYLLRKVRGMVSSLVRPTIPEFDIRLSALREYILSLRSFKVPTAVLADQKTRDRGSKVFAKNCATCHSSMRPLEVSDRTDRAVRRQDMSSRSEADFYLGVNFNAVRADDESLRTDYLSNELDVPVDGNLDVCSTEGHSSRGSNKRLIKNISLLNPWLHLPLLSRGSVGAQPWTLCSSRDVFACWKNKTYEFKRAMHEFLQKSAERRGSPRYLAANWHIHLSSSNINWTVPSGTAWPLVDQFREADFDQDFADSRRLSRATVVRASQEGTNDMTWAVTQFLRSNPAPGSFASVGHLELDRNETEKILRAYSNCANALQVHRFTESGGHEFGVNLSANEKRDLVEFLMGL